LWVGKINQSQLFRKCNTLALGVPYEKQQGETDHSVDQTRYALVISK